jgi:hypothetical protein
VFDYWRPSAEVAVRYLRVVTSPSAYEFLELEYEGFRAAELRYREETNTRDQLSPLVPLAEALWWAVSIDEGLKKLNTGYAALLESDPMGPVMRGLRYARNRIGHQRALVIKRRWFETFSQTADGRWVETFEQNAEGRWVEKFQQDFAWRRLEELPGPPPRQGDPQGAAGYESRLQGCWARDTLDECNRWLESAVSEAARPAAKREHAPQAGVASP